MGVQLPIFNRNQGNVAAAQADSERAKLEVQRVALTLRQRATSVLDEYANAKLMAVEYREELLPRAKKAYGLMDEKYGQMLASYPRVIETQRALYELQLEYIAGLENVWTTGLALQGYLLTDGLEAPAHPGDVDRPVPGNQRSHARGLQLQHFARGVLAPLRPPVRTAIRVEHTRT